MYIETQVVGVPTDAKVKPTVFALATAVVSSLAGTANQITASAATGAVTLSIPTSAVLVTPVFTTNITTPIVQSASTLIFKTNGTTTALTLGTDQSATFAGRVGIGTASPQTTLHSAGTTFSSAAAWTLEGTSSSTNGVAVDYPALILVNSNGSANTGIGLSFDSTSNPANQYVAASLYTKFTTANPGVGIRGDFSIQTRGADGLFQRFFIKSSGEIGIGNASPGGKLDITVAANQVALKSTGYSQTGSSAVPMLDLAGTVNTSGVVDVIKLALTNTAVGAGSKLLNLYAGAAGTTSVFSVGVTGNVLISGEVGANYVDATGFQVFNTLAQAQAGVSTTQGRNAIFDTVKLVTSSGFQLNWTSVAPGGTNDGANNANSDSGLSRNAAGILEINSGTAGTFRDLKLRNIVGQTGYTEMAEMTAPAAPATNFGRVYMEDSGGKTRLMVLFPTGSAIQLAIEP
jgi:hypothetical protein